MKNNNTYYIPYTWLERVLLRLAITRLSGSSKTRLEKKISEHNEPMFATFWRNPKKSPLLILLVFQTLIHLLTKK